MLFVCCAITFSEAFLKQNEIWRWVKSLGLLEFVNLNPVKQHLAAAQFVSGSLATPWSVATGLFCLWSFQAKNTGSQLPFQFRSFPTQELNSKHPLVPWWQADSLQLSSTWETPSQIKWVFKNKFQSRNYSLLSVGILSSPIPKAQMSVERKT